MGGAGCTLRGQGMERGTFAGCCFRNTRPQKTKPRRGMRRGSCSRSAGGVGRVRVLRFERLPPPPAPGRPSPLPGLRACPGALFLFLGCIPEPGRPHHALRPLPQMLRWSRCVQGREEGRSWGRPPRSPWVPGQAPSLPPLLLVWTHPRPLHVLFLSSDHTWATTAALSLCIGSGWGPRDQSTSTPAQPSHCPAWVVICPGLAGKGPGLSQGTRREGAHVAQGQGAW